MARECCVLEVVQFVTKLLVLLLAAPLGWTLIVSGLEGLGEGGGAIAAFMAAIGGSMLAVVWWMCR